MRRKKPPKGFVLNTVDLFLRSIPRDTRDAFKAYCARRGITMKDRVIELMQQDINSDIRAMAADKRNHLPGR